MGQEVTEAHYRKRDFQAFSQRLAEETSQLLSWVEQKRFSHQWRAGFELEAWLVDANLQPTPKNVEFLQVLDDSLVVPELSRFNFELNNESAPLQGNFLANFQQELGARWARCWEAASSLESAPVLIGTLPTLRAEQLTLENMSPMQRYRALNEQVLRIREGRPLQIAIKGEESLQLMHQDVMFEAATTSLQVHLQVPVEDAARVLNASMILSAPLVAAAANSPFLFGHALWEETRIPVFEQSVALTTDHDPERRFARVGFGSGYVTQGLESFFVENFENFAPLLPMQFEETASLPHLRLHNGTIWRWIGLCSDLMRTVVHIGGLSSGSCPPDRVWSIAWPIVLCFLVRHSVMPPSCNRWKPGWRFVMPVRIFMQLLVKGSRHRFVFLAASWF